MWAILHSKPPEAMAVALCSLSHRTQKAEPKKKTDEPIPDRAIPAFPALAMWVDI